MGNCRARRRRRYFATSSANCKNRSNFTERGLKLAREIGNREHEGSALNNLGIEYKELGDYEKANFYLTQALDIQRETRRQARRSDCFE